MPTFKFCPDCGTELVVNAKFCHECGKKLESGTSTRRPDPVKEQVSSATPEVPTEGFTVEFSFSTGANFELLLEHASKHPNFLQFGEGKGASYRVSYKRDEVDSLLELLERIKGIRNRRVWVDGQKLLWDEAFSWTWCYQQKKASYIPQLYCFGEQEGELNLWGCIQAHLGFTGYSNKWLTYGRFDRDATFFFDMDRIKHDLLTKLHRFRFCPALNLTFVDAILSVFPDSINPKRDKDWEFLEIYEDLPGAITIKTKEHGFEWEKRVGGVKPKSVETVKRIFDSLRKRALPGRSGT